MRDTSATRTITLLSLACFILLSIGCENRHGFFSAPYTVDPPPEDARADHGRGQIAMAKVILPDCTAQVELRNYVQTQRVIWAVVPIPIPQEGHWRTPPDEEGFCIDLSFTPGIDGMTFKSSAVVLLVDGEQMSFLGTLRRTYDANAPILERLGWEEEVEPMVRLKNGDSTGFRVCFAGQRPFPKQDIELQLDSALHHPGGAEIPPIRFCERKYKQAVS